MSIKSYLQIIFNFSALIIATTILSACGSSTSSGQSSSPSSSQLIFVAPSILPSLANRSGINYVGVYNTSTAAISGISYSLSQQVGSGNNITLDSTSATTCANVAARSTCFLKFSVPESSIAGGIVVTATPNGGTEAATQIAIGVQQIPYTESINANGVGLYFYPKTQYSESGAPFVLITAVVQSPNIGTVNTIKLVDESGNIIPGQEVISNNAGPDKHELHMGDIVEISLLLPQGANLTQNMKAQTSLQVSNGNIAATKLSTKATHINAITNSSTGTTVYSLTTQGSNINLQFTPNSIFLTESNPIQYGYLYNIGDLTASQIQESSSSPNVQVTGIDAILNGQRVIQITYELIDTSVSPTTSTVTLTAQNPSGQMQTITGLVGQNVNPLILPTQQWTQITGLGTGPTYAWIYGNPTPESFLAQDNGTDGQFWVYKNNTWTQITGGASPLDCDWNTYSCNPYGNALSASKIVMLHNNYNSNTQGLWKYVDGVWTQLTDGTGAGGTQPAQITSVASNATVESMFVAGDDLLWKYTSTNGWVKVTDGLGTNNQPTAVVYVIGSPTDSSMVVSGNNGFTFVYTTAGGWQQLNDGTNGTPPAPNSNTSYYGNTVPSSIVLTEGTTSPFNLWTYSAESWTNQGKDPRFIYGSSTPTSMVISTGLTMSGGSTIWTLNGTSWTQLTDGSTHGNTQPAYIDGNHYEAMASNAVPNLFYMIDNSNILWNYNNGTWTNINAITGAPSSTSGIFGNPTSSSIILGDNQSPSQLWTYNGTAWTQITGESSQPPSVSKEWVNTTNIESMVVSDGNWNIWLYKY